MELASLPSYSTCLWCSARWMSLSDLNLKVLCSDGERRRRCQRSCEKNFESERQMTCPETRDVWVCVCVYKFNTQNGVCLIAAWAVCKQHSISLMNTALTRALIQLAQNKRWRGGADVWERCTRSSKCIFYLPPTTNTQKSTDTNWHISPAHSMNFNLFHELLSLYLVEI